MNEKYQIRRVRLGNLPVWKITYPAGSHWIRVPYFLYWDQAVRHVSEHAARTGRFFQQVCAR